VAKSAASLARVRGEGPAGATPGDDDVDGPRVEERDFSGVLALGVAREEVEFAPGRLPCAGAWTALRLRLDESDTGGRAGARGGGTFRRGKRRTRCQNDRSNVAVTKNRLWGVDSGCGTRIRGV